jgi:hypothetical protein
MLDRRAASWASTVLVLALAAGCDEPPSYQVRWRIGDQAAVEGDPALAPALTSVKQCADVGVSKVRVTTKRSEDDTIVDVREYPCFPGAFERGEAVLVPTLPAGKYVVEVERVRRTGEPWICEEGQQCSVFVGETSNEVTVGEGLLDTVEVVLLQPAQCDDGIDNDRDGRVDGKDPACIFDPTAQESAESSFTLFQTSVTFLDSPAVLPANVGVAALRLGIDQAPADGDELDDELFAEVAAYELDTSQWPFRLPLLSYDFGEGDYVLSIYAVDGLGNKLTDLYEVEFSVPDEPYVVRVFEFSGDRFLAPIVQPIAVTTGLRLDPDDLTGPACGLGGFAGVAIDRTWFRVTDQDGQPVDAATLGLSGTASGTAIMPVDEANGWVSFACPTSMVISAPLSWGSYQLDVEAHIGDVTCFASEDSLPLAPLGNAGAQSLLISRIVDDQGAPPAGCEECFSDNDCSGQICVAGICKDKSP